MVCEGLKESSEKEIWSGEKRAMTGMVGVVAMAEVGMGVTPQNEGKVVFIMPLHRKSATTHQKDLVS